MGVLRWLDSILAPRSGATPSVTLDGITVSSKAEAKIANYFYQRGIRFEYEPTVRGGIFGLGKKISRPDFYLPQYGVYVEYWGLTNDPEYVKSMRWKMYQYRKHGLRFISLYPENLNNLDWIFRKKLEKATGVSLGPSLKQPHETSQNTSPHNVRIV